LRLSLSTGHDALVPERWRVQDDVAFISGDNAVRRLAERFEAGTHETWFEADSGRMVCVVTNGARALLMLLDHDGDAGEHLSDPSGSDEPVAGFVLANGQADQYAERDTVPLDRALDVLRALIDGGEMRVEHRWMIDR
jgi:hypothetical protein